MWRKVSEVAGQLRVEDGWATAAITLGVLLVVVLACQRYGILQAPRLFRRKRAGCIPLRVDPGGRLSVMLVNSRKHPEWWIFPAGGINARETRADAALRETREEAGLVGRLGRLVCEVSDEKTHTTMYALHVETEFDDWPEASQRRRRWFSLGVPGTSSAARALADLRPLLSPKPQQRHILEALSTQRTELRSEAEACENVWGRPRLRGQPASPTQQQHDSLSPHSSPDAHASSPAGAKAKQL